MKNLKTACRPMKVDLKSVSKLLYTTQRMQHMLVIRHR